MEGEVDIWIHHLEDNREQATWLGNTIRLELNRRIDEAIDFDRNVWVRTNGQSIFCSVLIVDRLPQFRIGHVISSTTDEFRKRHERQPAKSVMLFDSELQSDMRAGVDLYRSLSDENRSRVYFLTAYSEVVQSELPDLPSFRLIKKPANAVEIGERIASDLAAILRSL